MIRDFRTVVVVDIEATCYADNVFPPGERQEIIEIGICLLDLRNGTRSARQSVVVQPTASAVSPFCTDLTGLTPADVAAGMPLAQACALLQAQYKTRHRVWASYGLLDLRLFQSECRIKGVPYPFSAEHINIQTLFAMASPKHRSIGMAGALRITGLPTTGVPHHGADDAWNAAAVLYACLKGIPPLTATRQASLPPANPPVETEFTGQADAATAVWQIIDTASAVFASTENAFHWLASPQAVLAGKVPAVQMQSPPGRALVYGVLAGLNAYRRTPEVSRGAPGAVAQGAGRETEPSEEPGPPDREALVRVALDAFADVTLAVGWFHEYSSALANSPARLLATVAGRQKIREALAAIAAGAG